MKSNSVREDTIVSDHNAVARPAANWRRATAALVLAMLVPIALASFGCSSKKKVEDIGADDNASDASAEPQPPPTATVEISYSHPKDSMERATVSKYFGAEVIQTTQTHSGRSASVIRFDGGVPIWEIRADRSLAGRISDIGQVLDPQLRTAKVRIEVPNPGTIRLGMFVTATFQSLKKQHFALVPAPAILHLHDRDWVFVPAGGNQFRSVEIKAGDMVGDKQEILAGIQSGQQVVSNVLQLEATLEAQ